MDNKNEPIDWSKIPPELAEEAIGVIGDLFNARSVTDIPGRKSSPGLLEDMAWRQQEMTNKQTYDSLLFRLMLLKHPKYKSDLWELLRQKQSNDLSKYLNNAQFGREMEQQQLQMREMDYLFPKGVGNRMEKFPGYGRGM